MSLIRLAPRLGHAALLAFAVLTFAAAQASRWRSSNPRSSIPRRREAFRWGRARGRATSTNGVEAPSHPRARALFEDLLLRRKRPRARGVLRHPHCVRDRPQQETQERTLKVRVVFTPVARDELIPRLVDGHGDLIIADLIVTPERQKLGAHLRADVPRHQGDRRDRSARAGDRDARGSFPTRRCSSARAPATVSTCRR